MPLLRRHRRFVGLIAMIMVLSAAGCSLTLPPGVTDQSREISSLYGVIFVIAVAIFLFVEGLIVYSVIRYRRHPGSRTASRTGRP